MIRFHERGSLGAAWGSIRSARVLPMLAWVCLAAAPGVAPAEVRYTVMDLGGGFGGYDEQIVPRDINNFGQVVGVSIAGQRARAFRTAPNRPINPATDWIGTFEGYNTGASAINDLGWVVGGSERTVYPEPGSYQLSHAYLLPPGRQLNPATDDLHPPSLEFVGSGASDVNNLGQVVGKLSNRAFRTAPYSPINPTTDDLGTLGGHAVSATAINNLGQVVGWADTTNGGEHAFRTAPNAAINAATDDLGTLGGSYSYAYDINDNGNVVGVSYLPGNRIVRAFRTAPNLPINPTTDDLGTLGGDWSEAYGINRHGAVIGAAQVANGDFHAFLWEGTGPMLDLNNFIDPASGWDGLWEAWAINDPGQIVGVGSIEGHLHGFVLTPVPEPAGIGVAAIVLVSFLRRRWSAF